MKLRNSKDIRKVVKTSGEKRQDKYKGACSVSSKIKGKRQWSNIYNVQEKINQSKMFIPRKTIKNKYKIKTLSDKQK